MEVSGAQPVRPLVVHDLRGADGGTEQLAGALSSRRSDVSIHAAGAEERGGAGASRGDFVMMFTTPVSAFAPHTAEAGPRTTSICLMSSRLRGNEVPEDQPEEVEIDRTTVEQGQLRGRERARGLAGREIDVARRGLDDVHARHRAQQVAEILRRRRRQARLSPNTVIVAGALTSGVSTFEALTTTVSSDRRDNHDEGRQHHICGCDRDVVLRDERKPDSEAVI